MRYNVNGGWHAKEPTLGIRDTGGEVVEGVARYAMMLGMQPCSNAVRCIDNHC